MKGTCYEPQGILGSGCSIEEAISPGPFEFRFIGTQLPDSWLVALFSEPAANQVLLGIPIIMVIEVASSF